jgi:hypothetical protein
MLSDSDGEEEEEDPADVEAHQVLYCRPYLTVRHHFTHRTLIGM